MKRVLKYCLTILGFCALLLSYDSQSFNDESEYFFEKVNCSDMQASTVITVMLFNDLNFYMFKNGDHKSNPDGWRKYFSDPINNVVVNNLTASDAHENSFTFDYSFTMIGNGVYCIVSYSDKYLLYDDKVYIMDKENSLKLNKISEFLISRSQETIDHTKVDFEFLLKGALSTYNDKVYKPLTLMP